MTTEWIYRGVRDSGKLPETATCRRGHTYTIRTNCRQCASERNAEHWQLITAAAEHLGITTAEYRRTYDLTKPTAEAILHRQPATKTPRTAAPRGAYATHGNILAEDAVRATWRARDQAGVTALPCEDNPEGFVGHNIDHEWAAAQCADCPIRGECLALGYAESRTGRSGAMYGGTYFPTIREERKENGSRAMAIDLPTPEQRKAYVEALLNNPNSTDPQVRQIRSLLDARPLPIHRTEAGYPHCSTCDGGGCLDCTDPA